MLREEETREVLRDIARARTRPPRGTPSRTTSLPSLRSLSPPLRSLDSVGQTGDGPRPWGLFGEWYGPGVKGVNVLLW